MEALPSVAPIVCCWISEIETGRAPEFNVIATSLASLIVVKPPLISAVPPVITDWTVGCSTIWPSITIATGFWRLRRVMSAKSFFPFEVNLRLTIGWPALNALAPVPPDC